MKALTLILVFTVINVTSGISQLLNCNTTNFPGSLTVPQIDTLFDLAVHQEEFDCALRIYQYITTQRENDRDHFRAALSYYNQSKFEDAKELFVKTLTSDQPLLIWNNYYLGEIYLRSPADTTMAINFLFNEIKGFPSSSFAYIRLNELLNEQGDFAKLIELEELSEFDNKGESLKIAGYHDKLENVDEALKYYKQACEEGFVFGCSGAYALLDESKIKERIALLDQAIHYSKGMIEDLRDFYEPTSEDDPAEDSIYVVQEYKSNLAYFHLLKATEHDKLTEPKQVIENCDLALHISKGTAMFDNVFTQTMDFFSKYQVTEKILYYENFSNNGYNKSMIKGGNKDKLARIKTDIQFLDSIAPYFNKDLSIALLERMLMAYENLNYSDDFESLRYFIESKYKDFSNFVTYNHICLMHYSDPDEYETYLGNLKKESLYLNTTLMSRNQVFEVFMADFSHNLENESKREKPLNSLNKLKKAITTRNEQLTVNQQALVAYSEGLVYKQFCKNLQDCLVMHEKFNEALSLDISLADAVAAVDICSCEESQN